MNNIVCKPGQKWSACRTCGKVVRIPDSQLEVNCLTLGGRIGKRRMRGGYINPPVIHPGEILN